MTERTHRNALSAGYKLHWYEIKSVLGQGGFGITYLAQDLNLDRAVAIKEYLPSDFAVREGDQSVHPLSGQTQPQFEWGLERFISEARTLSKFEHPNIVRIFAVFEENNTGYLVMPYEEGTSLQAVLKGKKTLDESTLLKIIEPILDGLDLVHKHEFIHRDIKPDNIFIREDGSPVLLDFGSARQSVTGQVKTLTTLVSPGYAPFEQYYSKSDEQGPWTDIYGLGATLYRAIAGRPPLDAVDRSKSLLDGSQDTFMPAIQIGAGHYSESFLKAIDHAISFKPLDRPQTISEWRNEFDFNQENIATQISDRLENATTQPRQRQETNKNNKSKILILASLLIVMITAGVFYINTLKKELTTYAPELNAETEVPQQEPETIETEVIEAPEVDTEQENKLAEEKLLAVQQELEQERQRLDEERKLIEEERQRQEEASRQAEIEKQNQIEEEKRLAEQRRIEEEAKRLAEEKKREEEKRIAEEQRIEKEKKEAEEARLAEIEKQKQLEEQKRLEEEKRIAEEQRLEQERIKQEEAAKQKELEIENKIAASQNEFATRNAEKKDTLGFVDNVTAQDLSLTSTKSIKTSVSSEIEKWQNSGVKIKRGQTYKIKASGEWSLGPLCASTGPTGEGMYTVACWDLGFQIVAKRSHSALIGKIGQDTLAFYIGSDFTFTADKDGTLYLSCNDAPGFFFDNGGALDVVISLED
jgi:serine/threonine protein kinase